MIAQVPRLLNRELSSVVKSCSALSRRSTTSGNRPVRSVLTGREGRFLFPRLSGQEPIQGVCEFLLVALAVGARPTAHLDTA